MDNGGPATRRKTKMASATGIPAQAPLHDAATEDEPLLGGPGDASQRREKGLWFNLLLGMWSQRIIEFAGSCISY